jgi:hypothetical protein
MVTVQPSGLTVHHRDTLKLMPRCVTALLMTLPFAAMTQTARVSPLSTVAGEVRDAGGKPAPNAVVWWETAIGIARDGYVHANSDGQFELQLEAGSYRVCAVPEIRKSAKLDPTAACFPSTPIRERASATVVRTKPGEQVGPLRITLGRERVYSVEGRALIEVPESHGWGIGAWAISDQKRLNFGSWLPSPDYYEGHVNQKTGEFTIRGLTAGLYTILLEAGAPLLCDTCPMPPRFRSKTRIKVEHDVTGIVGKLLRNTSVTGRLMLDGSDPHPPVQEQMVTLDSGFPSYLGGSFHGTVNHDGLFRIDDVPPGSYSLEVLEGSQYFVTVRQNGRLAPGNVVRIESGSSSDLEITLRRATANILVKVEGEVKSWPSYPLSAVAIPADGWDDPYSWTGPAWVQEKGSVDLPVGQPGRYLVLVTQNLSGHVIEAWRDELRRHSREATAVIAKDGSTEAVTLRPVMLDGTDVGSNPQLLK